MDKKQAVQILKAFLSDAEQIVDLSLAILYGSVVSGRQHTYSDIDVALFVNLDADTNLIEVEKQLFKLRRRYDTRIEPSVFRASDLNDVDQAHFIREIQRTGEVIFSSDSK